MALYFLYLCPVLKIIPTIIMRKLLTIIILFVLITPVFPQSGIVHEVGVIAGRIEFRSDYGQRDNTENNINNMGFGISIVDYLNFSFNDNSNNYFKEHFKFRNELSYSKTNLKHYGVYVEGTSLGAKQLEAMRGSTQLISLGTQLEFFFRNIHDTENTYASFAPYLGLGIQMSYYTATATSKLGELGNVKTTYPKYLVPSDGRPHGYSNESKAVFSASFNAGTRYKLTTMSDLVLDLRLQYFNSDWVDGLNPNPKIYTENQSNDWLTFIGLGYIHYLEF
jgi:outer membrane protein W